MRKRALGQTRLEVSELSLGTWGLSGDGYGPIAPGEARRVMERARAMGITLFETADSYGMGSMESELGQVLGDDTEACVVTKWGTNRAETVAQKDFSPDYLRRCAESSRARLGQNTRIVALLHNPSEQAFEQPTMCATMKELVRDRVIHAWGVSVGSEAVARRSIAAGAQVLSFAYNIMQVQPLRSLAGTLQEQGIGVLAHSVLFYGLLTGRWAPGKEFRNTDHRADRWPDGALRVRIQQLDAVRPLVSGEVVSMRSAAVRFVLENPVVASAILGPRTSSQLDQLVRECQAEPPYLSEGKMSALENRLQHLEVPR